MSEVKPRVEVEAPSPSPRRRRRWPFVALGLILALLLAGAFLPLVLSSSAGRRWILSKAEARIGAPLEAESISLSWTGEQRISSLRLRSPPGFEGADLLRLKGASLRTGLFSLALSGSAALVLELDEPVVTLVRSKEGRFNFEGLGGPPREAGKRPEGKEPQRGPPRGEEPKEPFPRLELPRELEVRVKGGAVRYRDDLEAVSSSLEGVECVLSGGPGRLDLTLHAGWNAAREGGAPGKLEAQLGAKGGDVAASIDLADLDVHPLHALLERWCGLEPPDGPLSARLKASTSGGVVSFDAGVDARDSRGRSSVASSGTLEPASGGYRLKATGTLDASLPAAAAWGRRFVPEGLEISPQGSARLGDVSVEAALPSSGAPALDAIIARCSVSLAGGVKWKGWAVESLKAALGAEKGEIRVEGAECRVNGGRAVVESFAIDTREAPVALHGRARMEDIAVNYEMAELLAYVVPFLAFEERQALFTGKLAGNLELAGRGLDRAHLEQTLAGNGRVRITEGQLSASPFFREAAKLLRADLDRVLFGEIGSDFTIEKGKVDATRVYLNGKAGSPIRNLGLRGTTRFDGAIDYGVDLSQLEETVGDKKLRKVLLQASKVLEGGVFPLKLRGKLSAPALELDPELNTDKLIEGVKDLPVDEILELFGGKKKKSRK